MNNFFFENIYFFLFALFLAIFEIQSRHRNWLVGRGFRRNAAFFLLAGFVFVLPYIFGARLDFINIIRSVSLAFTFFIIADFLRFAADPGCTARNFKRENMRIRGDLFFGIPILYHYLFLASFLTAFGGAFFISIDIIFWWIKNLIFFTGEAAIVAGFALYLFGPRLRRQAHIKDGAGLMQKGNRQGADTEAILTTPRDVI